MTLPLPLLLAVRYLKSARREAYVTFLSLLATGGIALGVMALILVQAGLAGLQDFLRRDVLARTPHIEISWPEGADPERLAAEIAAVTGVLEARQLLRGRGWLLIGGHPIDVEIVGFEGDLPRFFPHPSSDAPGLYLDRLTADRFALVPGDLVEVISPRPTLTPFGPQPRTRQIALEGTFESGRTANPQDQRAAVPLAVARGLFGQRQTRLEVRTAGFEAALELAPRLLPLLPSGSVLQTWKDLNRGLFLALKLEKVLMFVSVFLIVPVAAMALVTVLALLISAKRGEIAMLQAMGARAGQVRRAFLALGALLGAFGLAIGVSCGVSLAWLLDHFQLVRPGEVYYVDYVPFLIQPLDLGMVIGATVLLVAASTSYAAHRAARVQTVETFRT